MLFVIPEAISILFVMRYAKKVKADKGSTFMSLQEDAKDPSFSAVPSGKQKAVLCCSRSRSLS